jgi:hypothetical protein
MMVAVALLTAHRFGWPRWSSTWIGYGFVFLLDLISTILPDGPLANLAGIAWLCVAVLLLFWLARRDWISGLLVVLPISPMWIWLASVDGLHRSLELAALFVSIGLMLSLAVVAIVRLGRWQTALLLILAVILAAGMPDSYGAHYSGSLVLGSQADPAAWSEVGGWMRSYIAIFLFTAPLWLMALCRQVQRRRAGGQNDRAA